MSPLAKPVKQKQRHLFSNRREFVKKEVKTLPGMRWGIFGKLFTWVNWVANVFLIPKLLAWRMCTVYTDLNRACPLDTNPLLSIHQMVDEIVGGEMMSFMDAFKGSHHIMMAEEDESKTFFITLDGLFCYKVMSFGLRNARATY